MSYKQAKVCIKKTKIIFDQTCTQNKNIIHKYSILYPLTKKAKKI